MQMTYDNGTRGILLETSLLRFILITLIDMFGHKILV